MTEEQEGGYSKCQNGEYSWGGWAVTPAEPWGIWRCQACSFLQCCPAFGGHPFNCTFTLYMLFPYLCCGISWEFLNNHECYHFPVDEPPHQSPQFAAAHPVSLTHPQNSFLPGIPEAPCPAVSDCTPRQRPRRLCRRWLPSARLLLL